MRLYRVSFALVLSSLLLQPALLWREISKPCPAGCLDNGNCNHELGHCECNFGWTGPSCETPILGACRSSNSPTALVMYGMRWPKNCECIRQILRFSYDAKHDANALPRFDLRWDRLFCYEQQGVPADQQFSDVPLANDTAVKWYKPLYRGPAVDLVFEPVSTPQEVRSFDEQKPMLPLKYCPDRCMDRGACFAPGTCMCRKGPGRPKLC